MARRLASALLTALREAARRFFADLAATEVGRRELRLFTQDFQVDVTGHGAFVVGIRRGRVTVTPGPVRRFDIDRSTLVEADAETWAALFTRRLRIMDAWFAQRVTIRPLLKKRWIAGWWVRMMRIGQEDLPFLPDAPRRRAPARRR